MTDSAAQKAAPGLNVVLAYTDKAGGYAGVRTWSHFPSKDELEKFLEEQQGKQSVVKEGVTQDEAVRLTRQTPMLSYVGAALEEAVDGEGFFHAELFQMKMQTAGIPMSGLWGFRGEVRA